MDLEKVDLYVILAFAIGFLLGRYQAYRARRKLQNTGEGLVSSVLCKEFRPPDYHLMNHVTLRMEDGTTQIDHILVSRFGVFVIETKHYNGWIFANVDHKIWTQVLYQTKFRFQNPVLQNKRHVRGVRNLLDFLPATAVKSVVVFTGDAEFKTEIPQGVCQIENLADFLLHHSEAVMSHNRVQFSVGRLETARLAISGQTDVEHVESLQRRHGGSTQS